MKRSLIPPLLAVGASAVVPSAFAEIDTEERSMPVLVNPRMMQEMRSGAARLRTSTHTPNDTTYVGFNPAYAGSNYWSVGAGHRRPPGNTSSVPDADMGYWDFDHPVHGDSLQGWWPFRHNYNAFFIANNPDYNRPWHAVDTGNQISYVINQGPGNRRTFGVTSAWHVDAGVGAKVPDPGQGDVNPKPPRWTPLAGSRSAWCGLRAHGDVTAVDALTGNPYNVDALPWVQHGSVAVNVGPGWTSHKFPGYAGQWDQMLFRDIDISDTTLAPSSANVSVSFRYRTRMSTGKNTIATTQTGWFDKDPLAVVAGNFISAPYVASVFQDAETTNNPDRHYQTLVDGWSLANLRSRMCDASSGRLAYMWNVFTNVFGKICAVAGTGPLTTEVPNNGDGRTFVDLAGIGNNPLREGSAVIHLSLAQADRVTVKVYDVSGRLVRTLADGQLFKAGRVDPALTWDGLDNGGRRVARGAYFVSVRYANSRFESNRKMIVLR